MVQKDITFKQNNVWRSNTYTGSWQFMVEGGGNVVTWDDMAIGAVRPGRRQQHELIHQQLDLETSAMRVLVAGDRGYIGAVLVPFVQAAGHEVVGLDVGWYDGCDFGAQPNGYEQRTGDIRDVAPEDLEGFDAVIHLAAISNDPIGHLNPEATYAVNASWGSTHGKGGQGRWGSALSLLVVLLALWRGWRQAGR